MLGCLALALPLCAQVGPSINKPEPGQLRVTQANTCDCALALPVGTAIKIRLERALSTTMNKAGDRFSGRVTEPVRLAGKEVIPVGAAIEGHVMQTSEPRRIEGLPTIDLRPEYVVFPNGNRYGISAALVDTSNHPDVEVNEEGEIKGAGHDRNDQIEVAAGAGSGALIGGLAGGGKGLLIGTGIGVTATVAHWLSKHRSAEVPAGTELVMELSRPLALNNAVAQ